MKRALDTLARKEGRGTELVSLYVPPGRQISDVLATLKQEYGTATNIKSDTTRKNVQDAITKVSQRLKLFRAIPENGLVIFSGAIPQNGPGSERMETYVVKPPEPINIWLYRCDNRFHTEHLLDLIKEKETFGIMAIDSTATALATLEGNRLQIVDEVTSGVPGKHRAGGQSARRFERLREAQLQSYYKRVGEHANKAFLSLPNLKGIIIGGPGNTKSEFEKGGYLQYTLKDKIVDRIDTAYVGEQGVQEIVDKAPEILQKVRYVEEKQVVQAFLYEIGHDTGLATYGEEEVKRGLKMGAVKTLLLSEDLTLVRVTVDCTSCGYQKHETMQNQALLGYEQSLNGQPCPKCKTPTQTLAETKEIIEEFAELAEEAGAEVEVVSSHTEEGQMLKKSFGGIAAVLRFKL